MVIICCVDVVMCCCGMVTSVRICSVGVLCYVLYYIMLCVMCDYLNVPQCEGFSHPVML